MKTRKTNRSKRNSNGCRNHGACDWCRSGRTHSNRKREPADDGVVFAPIWRKSIVDRIVGPGGNPEDTVGPDDANGAKEAGE